VQPRQGAAAASACIAVTTLQDQALLLLVLFPGGQGSPGGVFKYFPHALIRLRRALEVLERTDLLADILGLKVH
jgi:hypothetical protein